jgi:hypothetical protein
MDNDLLIRAPHPERKVEIARSFSYKLNVGNYESRDFFCSQKAECLESEADDLSERLYIFCRTQVLRAVAEYQRMKEDQQQRKLERSA